MIPVYSTYPGMIRNHSLSSSSNISSLILYYCTVHVQYPGTVLVLYSMMIQ